ncbi:PepSY-like domain-containing protein [Gramella sp. AN32]|uniref:PepSY-like domain-containing protein n=1 Tax=Christiangramia antarctica TaxID=2058158 RepID=A0ABW5WZF9_9FLAO|nr:PepSY-like domain-containing protein [Gramella sp. AN32]MCM4156840.1 hypothetical protein [Gramella sp. AN32]
MRKLTLLTLSILTLGILSCQEKKDEEKTEKSGVPEAVVAAFQKKYPGENDPDWQQDDHGYWESHFKIDGEKYRADFNADGTWVETENSIKKEDLPQVVQDSIDKNYADREITEIEHVINAKKGEFFDIEFKQKGKNMDVEMNKEGKKLN